MTVKTPLRCGSPSQRLQMINICFFVFLIFWRKQPIESKLTLGCKNHMVVKYGSIH